jgi:predicted metal-dependent HD superfamily phosphohydrolase
MEPRPHVYTSLLSRYTSPGRHYHDINHIENSLKELDRVRNLTEDPGMIELAIWFHDAVYDPERDDNEEKSAEYAQKTLSEIGLPWERLRRVSEMIKATNHRHDVEHKDTELLLDIDLSILGKPEKNYTDYTEKIRREYSHLPMKKYAINRINFLEQMLDLKSIYHTSYFRKKYEQAARRNLRQEIETLKRSLDLYSEPA